MLDKKLAPREYLFACYGRPGTVIFKFMVRKGQYKYIFLSNGGRRQLFDLQKDPKELHNLASELPEVVKDLHGYALQYGRRPGLLAAFEGEDFKVIPYTERPRQRINQMASDLGVRGFSFLP